MPESKGRFPSGGDEVFTRLITPLSDSEFFMDYWESKPFIASRRDFWFYAELFPLSHFENILQTIPLRAADAWAVKGGESIDEKRFIRDGFASARLLIGEYEAGATLILRGAHRYSSTLARLCTSMESRFTFPFGTNVYLTPPGSSGFKVHYDSHDVFVLQTYGSKAWQVFNRAVDAPIEMRGFDSSENLPSVTQPLRIDLKQGDLIYIPRGYLHSAEANEQPSLHITLGAYAYTWADAILEGLSSAILRNAKLRAALPVGFGRDDYNADEFASELKIKLFDAANNVHPDLILALLRQRFRSRLSAVENSEVRFPQTAPKTV
jgi:lysine-specific demethylase/histidyl-hydroxylase NO66